MVLDRKQIGDMLKLAGEYVVIDNAVYDPKYPNEVRFQNCWR